MAFDHWGTAEFLATLIGPVDTDPASNPHSHIQATRRYMGATCTGKKGKTKEEREQHRYVCPVCAGYANGHDGLIEPWIGRTFVNCPYTCPRPWADLWLAHQGPKLWLSEVSAGVSWFTDVASAGGEVWIFKRRLPFFDPRVGRLVKGARAGHMLVIQDDGDRVDRGQLAKLAFQPGLVAPGRVVTFIIGAG